MLKFENQQKYEALVICNTTTIMYSGVAGTEFFLRIMIFYESILQFFPFLLSQLQCSVLFANQIWNMNSSNQIEIILLKLIQVS